MIFAEPGRTKYDLNFQVGHFPVRVHPLFWLVVGLLALGEHVTLTSFLVRIGVSFLSILVHELGHAVAFHRFGVWSRITLHGLGGVATATDQYRARMTPRQSIIISAAGPLAELAIVPLTILVVMWHGYSFPFFAMEVGPGSVLPNAFTRALVFDLIHLNLLWAAANLLPLHPLDGGQIAEALFTRTGHPRAAQRSLWLSVVTGVVAAIGSIALASVSAVFLFLYLAFVNLQLLYTGFGERLALRQRWKEWRAARKAAANRRKKTAKKPPKLTIVPATFDDEVIDPEIARVADALLRTIREDIRREAVVPPARDDDPER